MDACPCGIDSDALIELAKRSDVPRNEQGAQGIPGGSYLQSEIRDASVGMQKN